MENPNPNDPFREARKKSGLLHCPFQDENVPMILRHADVRAAAKDWQTFSSNAPFRVPIPSEETVRSMRQLPIETDPPLHKEYRDIVEPYFNRPKSPEMIKKVECLIQRMVGKALEKDSIEIVGNFALPIQSLSLTYLLNVPESEANIWIGWGIHVFKVDGVLTKNGDSLEEYLSKHFDQVMATPSDDFFTSLAQADFQGRPLTSRGVVQQSLESQWPKGFLISARLFS